MFEPNSKDKNFKVVKVVIDGNMPKNCAECRLAVRSPYPEYAHGCMLANGAVTLAEELEGRPGWCPLIVDSDVLLWVLGRVRNKKAKGG